MNPKIDNYISRNPEWAEEIKKLRAIILDCGLEETLKWGVPCYTYQEHNVVLIHVFKSYCAILFFKGALLKDAKKLLVQQTANVQAARQLRFTEAKEITKLSATIKAYVHEAIAVEKAGLKVQLKQTREFEMPEEFKSRLDKSARLKKAFEGLTPGRQRAYLLHFSSAKQSSTREARVEKYLDNILAGKGIDE
jgi:uncharacterized protein YdeI (YjbR/CyaY-like superfamily)